MGKKRSVGCVYASAFFLIDPKLSLSLAQHLRGLILDETKNTWSYLLLFFLHVPQTESECCSFHACAMFFCANSYRPKNFFSRPRRSIYFLLFFLRSNVQLVADPVYLLFRLLVLFVFWGGVNAFSECQLLRFGLGEIHNFRLGIGLRSLRNLFLGSLVEYVTPSHAKNSERASLIPSSRWFLFNRADRGQQCRRRFKLGEIRGCSGGNDSGMASPTTANNKKIKKKTSID